MKDTALTQIHLGLGAKMAAFAGYNMPISYAGINAEHHQVRNSVGVFDVSHMGEFLITGDKALDLIQLVTTNDAAKLSDGKIQYSCMTNDRGGIVDDLLVYRRHATEYLLVVNASNIAKDWAWISSHNTMGAGMQDISDTYSLLAVQGPDAIKVLQTLTTEVLESIPYYSFVVGTMAGIDQVIISNTGYTGAGGFELYVKNEQAVALWNSVFAAGKEYGIMPCGLGCRDTLRMEKGFCLYGNDIDDTTSPIEAGLGWITKFTKPFVHSDYHRHLKETGVARKLVGIEMVDKGIARQHYKIKDASGAEIGEVTSGTQSPTLGKAIAMAYVQSGSAAIGTEVWVDIRNTMVKAVVVKTPFL